MKFKTIPINEVVKLFPSAIIINNVVKSIDLTLADGQMIRLFANWEALQVNVPETKFVISGTIMLDNIVSRIEPIEFDKLAEAELKLEELKSRFIFTGSITESKEA